MKYTVFFDQVNRTNMQVKATDEEEARVKANRLYKRDFEIPSAHVEGQIHWSTDINDIVLDLQNDLEAGLTQTNVIWVVNKTGGVLERGKVVYQTGVQGNTPTVDYADNTDSDMSWSPMDEPVSNASV